eukprot:968315-Pyramimonas_sp.AAC.1
MVRNTRPQQSERLDTAPDRRWGVQPRAHGSLHECLRVRPVHALGPNLVHEIPGVHVRFEFDAEGGVEVARPRREGHVLRREPLLLDRVGEGDHHLS